MFDINNLDFEKIDLLNHEKPKYRICENILFIVKCDINNFTKINDLFIFDYLLTNFPLIDTIIYNNSGLKIDKNKFQFNTNNLKIINDEKTLVNVIQDYDRLFYAYINGIIYFSFFNWLYFIRFNNLDLSFLYEDEGLINILYINKKNVDSNKKNNNLVFYLDNLFKKKKKN